MGINRKMRSPPAFVHSPMEPRFLKTRNWRKKWLEGLPRFKRLGETSDGRRHDCLLCSPRGSWNHRAQDHFHKTAGFFNEVDFRFLLRISVYQEFVGARLRVAQILGTMHRGP